MINLKLTDIIKQKRIEGNKEAVAEVLEYKKNLYEIVRISKRLNRQYERKKDSYGFDAEIFKLNDSVAYILKNVVKYGLSSDIEVNEIMRMKKPAEIRVY